jgi:hypothetical protein
VLVRSIVAGSLYFVVFLPNLNRRRRFYPLPKKKNFPRLFPPLTPGLFAGLPARRAHPPRTVPLFCFGKVVKKRKVKRKESEKNKRKKGKGPASLPRWVVTCGYSQKKQRKEEQHRIVTRVALGIIPPGRPPYSPSLRGWPIKKRESKKRDRRKKKRTSPTK